LISVLGDRASGGGRWEFPGVRGGNRPDIYRRAAISVDTIFPGVKPSVLPVEQPTKFKLVLNRTTAQALGLTVLLSLLFQADEVIRGTCQSPNVADVGGYATISCDTAGWIRLPPDQPGCQTTHPNHLCQLDSSSICFLTLRTRLVF
jgi:hypothetical protein